MRLREGHLARCVASLRESASRWIRNYKCYNFNISRKERGVFCNKNSIPCGSVDVNVHLRLLASSCKAMVSSSATRLTLLFTLITLATAIPNFDSIFSVNGNPSHFKYMSNGAVQLSLTNNSGSAGTDPLFSAPQKNL